MIVSIPKPLLVIPGSVWCQLWATGPLAIGLLYEGECMHRRQPASEGVSTLGREFEGPKTKLPWESRSQKVVHKVNNET